MKLPRKMAHPTDTYDMDKPPAPPPIKRMKGQAGRPKSTAKSTSSPMSKRGLTASDVKRMSPSQRKQYFNEVGHETF